MARTAISIQDMTALPPNAAITLATTDNPNGNQFQNDGNTILVFQNTSGGSLTATITSVADRFGRTGNITAQSIANNEVRIMGPFPQSVWNQSDGNIQVDSSASTLKVAAVRLARV